MPSAPRALTEALADRYRLERELGSGGMATVYLAEDLKHKRMVAVKVFRPELAATLGPERFAREIEVAARLQHPHILPLHDSGEARGFLYYVMPYVEGVSLRQRLTEQGELPIPDAVRILTEIVEALAYAHGQGVVHRDLKPDNIMLSGRHPMVMDFGIAKAVSAATGSGGVTTAGVALGTPAYMAPEQAAADPHLDHRVDIYAVGAMGYELLTGQPPFTGMSAQQILAAHMSQAPAPISTRRATVPPALASLLMTCLEKRPADRPQSAEEILHVLEALATPSGGQAPTSARLVVGVRPRWVAPTVAGAALLAVVATIVFAWRSQTGPVVTVTTQTQLTFDGDVFLVEIAPGGDLLAIARQTPDSAVVSVRDRVGGNTIGIARLAFVGTMRWSPDARSLLVTGVDSTERVVAAIYPRLGGPARSVPCGILAAWSPDGARMACWNPEKQTRIRFVDVTSLDTTSVEGPNVAGHKRYGDWSPSGAFLALSTDVLGGQNWGEIWILDISRRVWSKVVSDSAGAWSPRWSPDGKALYYLRGDELLRLQVGSDGSARGEPAVLQRGIPSPIFSLAADGRAIAYPRSQTYSNVWTATETGAGSGRFVTRQLTQGTARRYPAELSPDGRWVAYREFRTPESQGQELFEGGDVFVMPVEGGEPRQVTSGGNVTSVPAWSAESDRLAYITTLGGRSRVAVVPRDGGTEVTFDQARAVLQLSWAPGPHILYKRSEGNQHYHFLDPRTGADELLLRDSLGWMLGATALGNDLGVAVLSNRVGRRGVWIVTSPDSVRLLIEAKANQGLSLAGKSVDSRSIYVLESATNRLLEVALKDGSVRRIIPPPLPKAECTVSERQRLILVCSVEQAITDAWMIEDFDPAVPRAAKKNQ